MVVSLRVVTEPMASSRKTGQLSIVERATRHYKPLIEGKIANDRLHNIITKALYTARRTLESIDSDAVGLETMARLCIASSIASELIRKKKATELDKKMFVYAELEIRFLGFRGRLPNTEELKNEVMLELDRVIPRVRERAEPVRQEVEVIRTKRNYVEIAEKIKERIFDRIEAGEIIENIKISLKLTPNGCILIDELLKDDIDLAKLPTITHMKPNVVGLILSEVERRPIKQREEAALRLIGAVA